MNELAVLAEQYLDAHANRNRKPIDRFQRTVDKKFDERNERRNDRKDNDQKERTNDKRDDARNGRRNDRGDDRKCFVCGKKGHLAMFIYIYIFRTVVGAIDNARSEMEIQVDNAGSETEMQADNEKSETELQAVMTRSQDKKSQLNNLTSLIF